MIRTDSGFEIEIQKETLDDWELLEDLEALENGKTIKIISVAARLLGDEGLTKLKEHIRTPAGRVPMSAMQDEIFDIFQKLKQEQEEVKNS